MKLKIFLVVPVLVVLTTTRIGICQTTAPSGAGGSQATPAVPNNGAVIPNNGTVAPNNGAVVPDSGAMVPTNRSFGGVATNGVRRGLGTNNGFGANNFYRRGTNGFNRGTNGFGTNGFYRGPNSNNYPAMNGGNNLPPAGQNP